MPRVATPQQATIGESEKAAAGLVRATESVRVAARIRPHTADEAQQVCTFATDELLAQLQDHVCACFCTDTAVLPAREKIRRTVAALAIVRTAIGAGSAASVR